MSIQQGDQAHLPKGWAFVTIGETGEYINGFPFKPTHRESEGFPIVRIQNLTDETKALNSTTLDVPLDYKIDSGDMLMSWSATLDVFVWRRGPALVNQHIFKVVPDERVMSKHLLFYWLKLAIAQLLKTDHLHGSTMMHINRGPFMAHLVCLPPSAEQTRIVAKLEELLSELDAGVAELKAAQKKLARYRQSLLKAAVEGALTAAWRAQHTPTETGAQLLQRILTERRAHWEAKQLAKFKEQGKAPPKDWQKNYPEPVQPDTAGLSQLPVGWVWASLDQLLSQLRSGTAETSGRVVTPHPVLKSSAVRQGAIDFSSVNYLNDGQCRAENYLDPGDLLITRLNGSVEYVGCTALVENLAPTSIQYPDRIFCGKLALASPQLAAHIVNCMRSPASRQRIEAAAKSTAGHKRISLSDLLPFALPLPPLAEMINAGNLIRAGLELMEYAETAATFALKQSTAQRQNILRSAFAGQLVPQDPNDEPASVLLARIRAERADRIVEKKPRGRKAQDAQA